MWFRGLGLRFTRMNKSDVYKFIMDSCTQINYQGKKFFIICVLWWKILIIKIGKYLGKLWEFSGQLLAFQIPASVVGPMLYTRIFNH